MTITGTDAAADDDSPDAINDNPHAPNADTAPDTTAITV